MAKRHLTPDDEMGRLLEHRLQHAPAPAVEVCADAETLASYVDDGMSAAERAEWEAHFAACAKCRRALALMARLKETASPEWAGDASRDNPSPGGNLWVWMPLAACILVGAGLYFATRPAEPTFSASNTASGAGAAPVTQEARDESPRPPAATPGPPPPAQAPTPTPAASPAPAASQPSSEAAKAKGVPMPAPAAPPSSSAASAVPQRQLADRKDDALRERRAIGEAVTAKTRREAAAAEGEAGRAVGALGAAGAVAQTVPAPTPAPPPPPPEQYAVGSRAFQQQTPAQKSQITSGPREQQQAQQQAAPGVVGGNAAGAKPESVDAANVNSNAVNAVNARPSGPTNAANGTNAVNAPASAAAAKPAPAQQEKKNEPATPTFRAQAPAPASSAASGGAAGGRVAPSAPPANEPAKEPARDAETTNETVVTVTAPSQPVQTSAAAISRGKGAEDKLLKRAAAGNERDGDLAAQRAAGLLVVVADPARAERQWRVFKFGRIEVTRDGGGSWKNDVLRFDTTFTATATPAPGVCWIVGSKGTVWHLAPGDGRWQERRAPTDEDLVSVTATSGQDAVVAARSGQRFATSDAGKSWKRQ